MTRYQLSPDFEFCGFVNLPFAVMDRRTKDYAHLNRENFTLLYRLAAGQEFAPDALDEDERNLVERFLANGYLVEAGEGDVPLPRYRKYPNRYRPAVQWSITGRCNARCRHCFMSAPDAKFGEPTLEQCLDIVRQFDECGVRQVSLTGGEPFVRSDFWQIVDALLEHDIAIQTIYSNGFVVNQELLDNFKRRGLYPTWQISYDGVDGAHDWMRGVDGANEMTVSAIKLLVENGFPVTAASSLFKSNVAGFERSMELLADLGVFSVKTGCMQMQGEWLKHPEEHLSPEEELAFYVDYLPKYVHGSRRLSLQCEGLFMGYSRFQQEELRVELERKREKQRTAGIDPAFDPRETSTAETGWDLMIEQCCPADKEYFLDACECMRTTFYVGATGGVLPCMSLEGTPAGNEFPNVFETPLREILTDSHFTRMADLSAGEVADHNSECRECDLRLRCAAGCRAMAIGADGDDYLALDPRTCLMLKQDWGGKVRAAIESFEG